MKEILKKIKKFDEINGYDSSVLVINTDGSGFITEFESDPGNPPYFEFDSVDDLHSKLDQLTAIIKKGDEIRVKDNLVDEMIKLGFDELGARDMKRFEGTEQVALAIHEDDDNIGQFYVKVTLRCEIPLQCCEKIN